MTSRKRKARYRCTRSTTCRRQGIRPRGTVAKLGLRTSTDARSCLFWTSGQCTTSDAVRISMSIPLYFEAVFINANGNIIRHPRQKQGLDIMVDGGFTGNFPIHVFDTINKRATVGFRIDSEDQVKSDKKERIITAMPVANLKQYANAFYNIIIENLNRQQMTDEDWQRTISISDGNIGPRIRRLSQKQIDTLIENGRQAMKNYLN